MIRDTTAHRIAADWHGGQSSALYTLSSSGAIVEGLLTEIDLDMEEDIDPKEVARLASLYEYAKAKGPRGPQNGWYQNVIKRAYN